MVKAPVQMTVRYDLMTMIRRGQTWLKPGEDKISAGIDGGIVKLREDLCNQRACQASDTCHKPICDSSISPMSLISLSPLRRRTLLCSPLNYSLDSGLFLALVWRAKTRYFP